MASKSTLLGAAGEHYIMSQLLRRGLIAALAPAGVPNCDIIVSDEVGDRLFAIQVKSRVEKGGDGGWHMREKHEHISSDRLFYTFVDFGADIDGAPSCFVVPSVVVAETVRRSYQCWRSQRGKGGRERRETELRRFLPNYDKICIKMGCSAGWLEQYRNNWSQLEAKLATTQVS